MEEAKDDKPKAVKLPYFHRTLSPEETALIGDTSPKPITENAADASSVKIAAGSAWNSAQTWEERDCTKWAMEKLPQLFSESEDLPKSGLYTVTIKDLSNAQGSAQIAHVRGKARFIYELSFDLKFSVVAGDKKYKGKVSVADVINDQLDDIELSVTWDKSPPGAELAAVRNAVISGTALRKMIRAKMATFEQDFRQL
jgi:activator of HSP90 ATPase